MRWRSVDHRHVVASRSASKTPSLISVFPTSMASSMRDSGLDALADGRPVAARCRALHGAEPQHLVHAPRAISLQVEGYVLEAQLLEAPRDGLGKVLGEEARKVLGRQLDTRNVAVMADPDLPIPELSKQLLCSDDL